MAYRFKSYDGSRAGIPSDQLNRRTGIGSDSTILHSRFDFSRAAKGFLIGGAAGALYGGATKTQTNYWSSGRRGEDLGGGQVVDLLEHSRDASRLGGIFATQSAGMVLGASRDASAAHYTPGVDRVEKRIFGSDRHSSTPEIFQQTERAAALRKNLYAFEAGARSAYLNSFFE